MINRKTKEYLNRNVHVITMVKLEKSSKVRIHDKKYYATLIPKRMAEEMLGLKLDKPNQRIEWKIKKGKVIVEVTQ